jgi:hypothetical protein
MADKKTEAVEVVERVERAKRQERVPYVYPPITNPQEPDFIVAGVNGKNMQITRGVTVKLPESFVENLDNSLAGERAALEASMKSQREYFDKMEKFK